MWLLKDYRSLNPRRLGLFVHKRFNMLLIFVVKGDGLLTKFFSKKFANISDTGAFFVYTLG